MRLLSLLCHSDALPCSKMKENERSKGQKKNNKKRLVNYKRQDDKLSSAVISQPLLKPLSSSVSRTSSSAAIRVILFLHCDMLTITLSSTVYGSVIEQSEHSLDTKLSPVNEK